MDYGLWIHSINYGLWMMDDGLWIHSINYGLSSFVKTTEEALDYGLWINYRLLIHFSNLSEVVLTMEVRTLIML